MSKPKYRIGQRVYSYQNPKKRRRISHIRKGEGGYPNAYKLSLRDKDGYSYSSKWIDEGSIKKTIRRRKYGRRSRRRR